WINYNGLLEFKIKVNGTDMKWDLERVIHIDKVVTQTQEKRGVKDWAYLLDFNEKCPNVDYFIQFCRQLKEKIPEGYGRIKYTEQPTARDLKTQPYDPDRLRRGEGEHLPLRRRYELPGSRADPDNQSAGACAYDYIGRGER